jgi:hypothetical protein
MNHNFWLIEMMIKERQETIRREAEIRRRITEAHPVRRRSTLKAAIGRRLMSWGALLMGEHNRGCIEA